MINNFKLLSYFDLKSFHINLKCSYNKTYNIVTSVFLLNIGEVKKKKLIHHLYPKLRLEIAWCWNDAQHCIKKFKII